MTDDLRAEAKRYAAALESPIPPHHKLGLEWGKKTAALLRRLAAALPQSAGGEWPESVVEAARRAASAATGSNLGVGAALSCDAVRQHIAAREAEARREGMREAVKICECRSEYEQKDARRYPSKADGGDGSREEGLSAATTCLECAVAIRAAAEGGEHGR